MDMSGKSTMQKAVALFTLANAVMGQKFKFYTEWIDKDTQAKRYALNKYWDKPSRKSNKYNFTSGVIEKLNTVHGKDKKIFLKWAKTAHNNT